MVYDRFTSQNAFAFGVQLDRQFTKMDLEDDQVIFRFLDHDFEARLRMAFHMPSGTAHRSKDGLHALDIQPGTGVINQRLNQLLHLWAIAEQ